MARSTCNPNVKVPKGMMKFEVIRSTIKDSLGQYCGIGDMAVLTQKLAQRYLDMNFIKVALPEFDFDNEKLDDEKRTKKTDEDVSSTDPQSSYSDRDAGAAEPAPAADGSAEPVEDGSAEASADTGAGRVPRVRRPAAKR